MVDGCDFNIHLSFIKIVFITILNQILIKRIDEYAIAIEIHENGIAKKGTKQFDYGRSIYEYDWIKIMNQMHFGFVRL